MAYPVDLRGATAPTKMWAEEWEVEPQALQQLRNISTLPWVRGIRVMPDVHLGKGATVGSVIAMKDAVSPNAVGVDIGCGMIGVRTSLTLNDLPDDLGPLRSRIESSIPVGFSGHASPVAVPKLRYGSARLKGQDAFWKHFSELPETVQGLEGRAAAQLGTLGGGNHFIELCVDDDENVWLQLHSGSRNIGKTLAEYHVAIAKKQVHNENIVDKELAVLLGGTSEMDAYLRDLHWAQEYALRSREVMMSLVKSAVQDEFTGHEVVFTEVANVHHNYVSEEYVEDLGEKLVVTRKGAIRAGKGDLGLIPGSMGTGSYIVRGLGNPASFESASHGAGRKMSRGEAKRTFTVDDLIAQTAGVECRKDQGVVDEIPGAYKNLDDVIKAQEDLVEVVARLNTLLCVKG